MKHSHTFFTYVILFHRLTVTLENALANGPAQ